MDAEHRERSLAVLRRMAATGYIPSAAILRGLGLTTRDFVDAHNATNPPPAARTLRAVLIDLAERVTGEQTRRPGDAVFALTQAVFDRGDVALSDEDVPAVLDILREVRAAGWSEGRAADVLDAAIGRLTRRDAGRKFRPTQEGVTT